MSYAKYPVSETKDSEMLTLTTSDENFASNHRLPAIQKNEQILMSSKKVKEGSPRMVIVTKSQLSPEHPANKSHFSTVNEIKQNGPLKPYLRRDEITYQKQPQDNRNKQRPFSNRKKRLFSPKLPVKSSITTEQICMRSRSNTKNKLAQDTSESGIEWSTHKRRQDALLSL